MATRNLLWAGVIGPIAFLATFTIDGVLRPGWGRRGFAETAGLFQRVAIVSGWQWLVVTALLELRSDVRASR